MLKPAFARVLAVLLAGLGGLARADDAPPLFAKLSFDEAKAATKGNDKILVVKFIAVWCGPCKQMDRTTWRDEKVVAWFKENGLAIHIDVDKEQQIAAALKIRAMPTMVAFKNGAEFDRTVGYQSAEQLLPWLAAVKRGERSSDATLKKLEGLKSGQLKLSVRERMLLARELAQLDKLDEATEQFVWVWEHSAKEPGMGGVRVSFLVSDITNLASQHAPARRRFTELRDALAKKLESDTKRDPAELRDWFALNEMVGERKATWEWFERVRGTPAAKEAFDDARVLGWIERLLDDEDRWVEIAALTPDPLAKLRERHANLQMTLGIAAPGVPREARDEMSQSSRRFFRDKTSKLYAGLLNAKRAAEAAEYAALAIELDDSPEMRIALVELALQVRQPQPEHAEWLAAAEKAGANVDNLNMELHKALAEK